MASKNCICLLVNNIDFFKHQVDNYLPDCDIIVCNETRIGDKTSEIKKLLPRAIVIDSKDVVNEFSKICDTEFLHTYTMGMNILLQWYLFKYYDYEKILFTEEDVLFNEKINNIFNEENNLFYVWSLSAQCVPYDKLKNLRKDYVDEFDKIFDLNFDKDKFEQFWKKTHISSGQRFYVKEKFDLTQYEKYLIGFFESEVFKKCWETRRTHRTFYLDERFEGFAAYKMTGLNCDMKPYTHLEISKPEKRDFTKYKMIEKCGGIWHNATVNQKQKWYEALKENKLIK